MTPSKKSKKQADLASMVCQLQHLADQIHQQVDQELARLEQARHLAAQESARLESLLAKTHSKPNARPEDTQDPLPQMPLDVSWQHASCQSDAQASLFAKHRKVYDLSEKGLGPLEIAQQTGQTIGQIQVILALRKPQ